MVAPYIAIPLIDRHFDKEWEKQQAELSREISDLRSLGEDRREWRERRKDFASLIAGAIAVRKLMEDGRGPWAKDDAPDSNPAGSGKSAWDAETPAADKDPWAAESPDLRYARPVAVKTAPEPVEEVGTGPSNYEKALNSLQAGARGRPATRKRLKSWRPTDARSRHGGRPKPGPRGNARRRAPRKRGVSRRNARRKRAGRRRPERGIRSKPWNALAANSASTADATTTTACSN